ncbi:hypothetical protein [uncultured Ruegeria sp.]|uniref:hypothetical protein n=1 Tax=uncultured Ruegeria sp. TaxID=259304 RepID=UPI0026113DAB|nr:hypothetical protein [uncultured Ruegeria sp.]
MRSLYNLSLAAALVFAGSAQAENKGFFIVTNKADENSVVGYQADDSGIYKISGEYSTGGKGTGDLEIPDLKKDPSHPLANGDDPLISANSLSMTADGRYLAVVNPGDATVSLMSIDAEGALNVVNTVDAPDQFPISLAFHDNLLAVAGVGMNNSAGSIGMYQIVDGKLQPVAGSLRDLKARPSTIAFSSTGDFVIVNELVTGEVKIFGVQGGSLSAEPVSQVSSPRDAADRFQAIPVGFAVSGDTILMSEARFLTPDFMLREGNGEVALSPLYSWQTGSLSTYKLSPNGAVSLVSGDVLTGDGVESGEIANCWVAVSHDGTTLWAANALSSSISSFRIRENGTAALLNARAFKDPSETLFFSDIEVSADGSEIYQLVGNRGQVMVFSILSNGDLELKQTIGGLPEMGTYGLVVY